MIDTIVFAEPPYTASFPKEDGDVSPIPTLLPSNTNVALSLNNPLAPAYVTRPLVRLDKLKLAPAIVPVSVGLADKTLLPVPVFVTETTFLLASKANAVDAVSPDSVVVPLTVILVTLAVVTVTLLMVTLPLLMVALVNVRLPIVVVVFPK